MNVATNTSARIGNQRTRVGRTTTVFVTLIGGPMLTSGPGRTLRRLSMTPLPRLRTGAGGGAGSLAPRHTPSHEFETSPHVIVGDRVHHLDRHAPAIAARAQAGE